MAKAGAPLGNNNAGKNKRWSQAIDKALKQYNEGDVQMGQALDKIAMKLVRQAIKGDSQDFKTAMQEIGDRIEGKVPTAITGEDGGPLTVELITEFIREDSE